MSPFDLGAGQCSRVGFMPASGSPDVKWIRPNTPAYLPPPMSARQETHELVGVSAVRLGGREEICELRSNRRSS
jgi:hypothetical protein